MAILTDEAERRAFNEVIEAAPVRLVSAATVLEAGLVIESRKGEHGGRELDLFLHRAQFQIVPVDADQVELARTAYQAYGKGRHPATLKLWRLLLLRVGQAKGRATAL